MRIIKVMLFIIAIVITGISLYYFVVILEARSKTPKIVHHALKSERMQLALADLSDQQLEALLKIQDPNFYHHKGYDFETPGAGITSLSQGLVKQYYFDHFQPGLAKIKQTLIARFAFDPLTPKDTILKLFINDAYFGQHDGKSIHGFEDAANFYFKKKFKALDWDEYLSLAAMIRGPYAFNYIDKREANRLRVQRIKKMLSGEYIPQDNSDQFYDRK